MRTLTATQQTDLARTTSWEYARIEVQNADGTWIEITNLAGLDWFLGADFSISVDKPHWLGTFRFRRDRRDGSSNDSLAPLRTDSGLNVDDLAAYAALLDPGRGIRADVSVVAPGLGPTYVPLFSGTIDDVDPADEEILVVARSAIGADIIDSLIEDRTEYGTTGGTPLETVIQSILDDWSQTTPTLWTPTSPAFSITPGWWQGITLRDALTRLTALRGWAVQEVYDDSTAAWRLRLADPDRSRATIDWTFAPQDCFDVQRAAISRTQVRNVIRVTYFDSNGDFQEYTASDAASIARYGRRFMQINEPVDSPIDTPAEAQVMAEAALEDLKEPDLEFDPEMRFFWPAQLGDRYRFGANDLHFNNDQDLAVLGITHRIRPNAPWSTTFRTHGRPVGYRHHWLRFEDKNISARRARDVWIQLVDYYWEPAGAAGSGSQQNWRLKAIVRTGPAARRVRIQANVSRPNPGGFPDPQFIGIDYAKGHFAASDDVQEFTVLDGVSPFDFRVWDDAGTTYRDTPGTVTLTPYHDLTATDEPGQPISFDPGQPGLDGTGVQIEKSGGQSFSADKLKEGSGVTFNILADGSVEAVAAGGGASALNDLSDVTISSPAAGHFLRFNGTAWVNELGVALPDGGAPSPSLRFASDPDTGFYRPGADQLGITLGGTVRATFLTTALRLESGLGLIVGGGTRITSTGFVYAASGTVATPGIGFTSDPDTGIYPSSSNVLAVSAGATQVATFSSAQLNVVVGNLSLAGTVRITSAGLVRAADGTVGAPGVSFGSDTDNGMYRSGTNAIGLVTAGAARLAISAAGNVNVVTGSLQMAGTARILTAGTYRAPDGTAGTPAVSFATDTDTGMFLAAANALALAAGAAERFRITHVDATHGQVRFQNAQVHTVEGEEITRDTAGSVNLDWDAYNSVDLRNDGNIDEIDIDDASMIDGNFYTLVIRYAVGGQASITFTPTGTLQAFGTWPPTLPTATVGDRTMVQFYKTGGLVLAAARNAPA